MSATISTESEDSNSLEVKASRDDRISKNLELLLSGRFSDFEICVEGKTIKVHRSMLSGYSYFDSILSSENQESTTRKITITDFTEGVVLILLRFMYTGSVKLDTFFYDNIEDVLRASDKYNLDRLLSKCEKYLKLKLNLSNAIRYLLIAKQTNASSLRQAAMDFVSEHVDELEKTADWKLLAKENILIVDALKSNQKKKNQNVSECMMPV